MRSGGLDVGWAIAAHASLGQKRLAYLQSGSRFFWSEEDEGRCGALLRNRVPMSGDRDMKLVPLCEPPYAAMKGDRRTRNSRQRIQVKKCGFAVRMSSRICQKLLTPANYLFDQRRYSRA
jgi:hypothetical protein